MSTGLLLGHNCPQAVGHPTRGRAAAELPEPGHGWPELADTDAIGFRPGEAVNIAAAMYPAVPTIEDYGIPSGIADLVAMGDHRGRYVDPETGEIFPLVQSAETAVSVSGKTRVLRISSGVLSIQVGDLRKPDDYREQLTRLEETMIAHQTLETWGDQPPEDDPDGEAYGVVGGFSRKSRQRCRAAGAKVDWAAAIEPGDRMGMVTLTYPDNWRRYAPDPASVVDQRRKLAKRFERATGRPMACIWKREFQRRGAPHLHLFGPWPMLIAGQPLQTWLSQNWYDIVASGDPKHLAAGTGVDWAEGLRMSDPVRVGNYFASYATGGGYKDYQNRAPDDWTNDNGSVGRYWGITGLETATAEVRITPNQMVDIQRYLRGVLASQKRTMAVRVQRGNQTRQANRRYKLRSLEGTQTGFMMLTNDGPQLATDIARALTLDQRPPWPPGQPRPLP